MAVRAAADAAADLMAWAREEIDRILETPDTIEEDQLCWKVAAAIPIVGFLVSLIFEASLAWQIANTTRAPRAIQLIEVKNHYKYANVLRNLLQAALLIAGIAFGILSNVHFVGAFLFIGFAIMKIYHIKLNQDAIKELQSRGFRSRMTFL